uniref:ATP synthase subunit epsilon, mitochondrial n=1 Tax=Heterorhabditis bacteriophora TaxID=37862 RepID=A0A1I7X2F5_HETBA
MVAWRAVGINYVRFSQIAAEVTKQCVKGVRADVKKPAASLKVVRWENGKMVKKE